MNQVKCAELLCTVVKVGQERLKQIGDSQASLPRAAGKWSPKEIIGHLIDSAINNYTRFASTQDQDELLFNGYQQEEWVIRGRYHQMPWHDLITLWSQLNLQLARLIKGIPENIYSRKRSKHNLDIVAWKTIPEKESTALAYFARDYTGHIEHPLGQVWDDYKSIGSGYSNQ